MVNLVRWCARIVVAPLLVFSAFAVVPWIAVSRPGALPSGVVGPEVLAVIFALSLGIGAAAGSRRMAQGLGMLGLIWVWLLASRFLAQAIAPGAPAWDPAARGASQPALLVAAALAALLVRFARPADRTARGQLLAVGLPLITAWLTVDACRAALLATQPAAGIPANWTASEQASRALSLAVLLAMARRSHWQPDWFRFTAALTTPFLAALGAVGLAWIWLGAAIAFSTTWQLAAAACGTLVVICGPLAIGAERRLIAGGITPNAARWLLMLRLAGLLALAEQGISGLTANLGPGHDIGLSLAALEIAATAALAVRFVPRSLRALLDETARHELTAGRNAYVVVVRRLVGLGLFSLAFKQLVEVALAIVAAQMPDASLVGRLAVYGVALLAWRVLDLLVRLRTGRSVGVLLAGPAAPVALVRLEYEVKGIVGLAGVALGTIGVLVPAFVLTFNPVVDAAWRVWLMLPSLGAILALAVRACLAGQRITRKDESIAASRLIDVEPYLGLVLAGGAVLIGLTGVLWAVLDGAASGSLAVEARPLRLALFGALVLLGVVAAVEYRRTAERLCALGSYASPPLVVRAGLLVMSAGCIMLIGYGTAALTAAALALPGMRLPLAQPMAGLLAGVAVLPLWMRMAAADRAAGVIDGDRLATRILVFLPMGAMAVPPLVSLVALVVVPMAVPGIMFSLPAELVGVGVAAGLGWGCRRYLRGGAGSTVAMGRLAFAAEHAFDEERPRD